MKLLKSVACLAAADGGNVKRQTVMGDASMDGFSDRGSIPLRSTIIEEYGYMPKRVNTLSSVITLFLCPIT